MIGPPKLDMLVLVADRNMESTVRGLLSRWRALGIRRVQADIERHPEKDAGCRAGGVEYLSAFVRQYRHALLMFDREGCGEEALSAEDIEVGIEQTLARSGWGDRAAVIVFDPELEVWVWSNSPHVVAELGWAGRRPDLKSWLRERDFWSPNKMKPDRPKEALETALRQVHKPRSSSLYQSLAEKVSLKRCTDRAFAKFRTTMQNWFRER